MYVCAAAGPVRASAGLWDDGDQSRETISTSTL